MLKIAIMFISISLALTFIGQLTETFSEEKKTTDLVETIWDALILLAWAFVVKTLT